MDRQRLVTLFRHWGDVEATANLSPLYAVFGHAVAENEELLELANEALEGQPPPNVLFAAVHALLASTPGEPLAAYYATLGGDKPADADAAELLARFCRDYRDELLPVIRTRLVQTNEVRRSAVLLPAFASIAEDSGKSLALIEIGPSAGLNLLFDRYQYHYREIHVGDPASQVVLDCEPRAPMPEFTIPNVASRTGIDLNPLDVTNPEDVSWLRALLWPEHTDRLALMNAAIEVARREPPTLLRGALFNRIPELVMNAPADATACLFATFVLNQFTPAMLERLRQLLLDLSTHRELFLVIMGFSEFIEPGTPRVGDTKVWVLRLRNGAGEYRLSSLANPHGRWIDLCPESEWHPWRE